jgi:hypothetical protein
MDRMRIARGLVAGLLGLLALLPADALAQTAAQRAREALVAGPIDGLRQVDALEGLRDARGADALRRGLLLVQIGAAREPLPRRAGELITEAERRGPDGEAAWAAWFNTQVQLRWLAESTLPPAFGTLAPGSRALGPGAWVAAWSGGADLVALVRVSNASQQPLLLPPPKLLLRAPGSEWPLDCELPAAPVNAPPALADSGERVPPGGGRTFVCRAAGADTSWADTLMRAATGQATPGEAVAVTPPPLADRARLDQLLRAWAGEAPPVAAAAANPANVRADAAPRAAAPRALGSTWRTVVAVGAVAALLLMAVRTVYARIDGDESAARAWLGSLPAAGVLLLVAAAVGSPPGQALFAAIGDAAGHAMRALMARFPMTRPEAPIGGGGPAPGGGALAPAFAAWTIGLYAGGRLLQRLGFSRTRVRLMTWFVVLVLGPLSAAAVWSPPAGEGWSRAVPIVLMLVALGFFIGVGVAVALMRGVDDLCEREDTSWFATVLAAWRRSLHFGGTATRAELWGYLAFYVQAWALARLFVPPWDRGLALVLLLPLPALVLRRLRGLTDREAWTLAALLALTAYPWLGR